MVIEIAIQLIILILVFTLAVFLLMEATNRIDNNIWKTQNATHSCFSLRYSGYDNNDGMHGKIKYIDHTNTKCVTTDSPDDIEYTKALQNVKQRNALIKLLIFDTKSINSTNLENHHGR